MKIAINKCYGGFSLSNEAGIELRKLDVNVTLKGEKYSDGNCMNIINDLYLNNENFGIKDNNYHKWRSDKRLIQVIEKLGVEKASGEYSKIRIIDIPNDIEWDIDEYDGIETIHEKHRSW